MQRHVLAVNAGRAVELLAPGQRSQVALLAQGVDPPEHGLLAVADVVADHPAGVMRGTLLAYAVLYALLLAAYVATLRHLSAKPAASLQLRAGEAALAGGKT